MRILNILIPLIQVCQCQFDLDSITTSITLLQWLDQLSKNENQENRIENRHITQYIVYKAFEEYSKLDHSQKKLVDTAVANITQTWDGMTTTQQQVVAEQYKYFMKLPNSQKEQVLQLLSDAVKEQIDTKTLNTATILQQAQDILIEYQTNPTTVESNWHIPTHNDNNYGPQGSPDRPMEMSELVQSLLKEGKSEQEVREIIRGSIDGMIPESERGEFYTQLDELLKKYKPTEEEVVKKEDVATPLDTTSPVIPIIVGFLGGVGLVVLVLLLRRWCLLRRSKSAPSSAFSIAEQSD